MAVVKKPVQTLKQFDSPRRVAVLKLVIAARRATQLFDLRARRAGVSRADWSLIAAVARNPGTTQRRIAAMLEVTEVTAGRQIDRLCARQHLERRQNPTDRRGYCIYLTPAAQPILDLLGKVAAVQEDDIFKGIDAEELALLDATLSKILQNIARFRAPHCGAETAAVPGHAAPNKPNPVNAGS